MYDPQVLLQQIDAQKWLVMTLFGVDSLFQVWWLSDAVRVAKRDRAYSIPLFCTLFWFAHDFGCVVRFQDWFFVYDHWYLKLFWGVLLLANLLEWFFLWQVHRYGREELAPDLSPRGFGWLLAAGVLLALVAHELFKGSFGDPLFQLDPTLTMIVYPAFGAAMLLRRRSARGQTPRMWWNFTAMTALFHLTTYLCFGPAFQTVPYVAAAVVATLGGVAMAWVVAQPRWRYATVAP
ncbi:MAG TPA: hypothetical protein VFY35_15365 [Burkholderiaceae bacterium]|nr:hypothetical protein [Burkholderiaceae bacterium]